MLGVAAAFRRMRPGVMVLIKVKAKWPHLFFINPKKKRYVFVLAAKPTMVLFVMTPKTVPYHDRSKMV